MKLVRVIAVGACVALVLILVGASARGANDRALKEFTGQLVAALPAGAQPQPIVDARVGVLTGNGNHCDFVVELVVRWAGSREALETALRSATIAPARAGGAGGGLPTVSVRADQTPGQFTVALVDAPYSAGFDLRCHERKPTGSA